jgi:hypothetical protein
MRKSIFSMIDFMELLFKLQSMDVKLKDLKKISHWQFICKTAFGQVGKTWTHFADKRVGRESNLPPADGKPSAHGSEKQACAACSGRAPRH